MKKLLALLTVMFLFYSGISQDCPPGGGELFKTQAQIDKFGHNYPNCTHLEGGLCIGFSNMSDIRNLDGLSNITTVDYDLLILNNPNLKDLEGLNNLQSIGGDIIINYNFSLKSLEALSSLTSIGGSISICDSPFLTNLSGLENIDASTITDIEFFRNNSLTYCSVKSICDFLKSSNAQNLFYYNATGCNSREEVDSACSLISVQDLDLKPALTIYPNPVSTNIIIGIPDNKAMKSTFLAICNLNGQPLIKRRMMEPVTVVDVSGWVSGVYFVKVTDDKSVMVGKFIKQ